jgi:NAD(P) transhydrogenase subunit alpha
LFGTNLCHLLDEMGGAANFRVDRSDEVVGALTICHGGETTWPPPPRPAPPAGATAPPTPAAAPPAAAAAPAVPRKRRAASGGHGARAPSAPTPTRDALLAVTGLALLAVGALAPAAFLTHLLVFVLACFIGWQVVWSVTPALHTPLMSVTNAVSGIILIGGMVQLGGGDVDAASLLGAMAILLAAINVAGGFLVTQRMLKMFRRESA